MINFEEIEIEPEAKHLFLLSQILDKTGFKVEEGTTMQNVTFNMVASILKGLHKAEKEVLNFIYVVYKLEDKPKLSLKELITAIKVLFKNEDFKEALSILK